MHASLTSQVRRLRSRGSSCVIPRRRPCWVRRNGAAGKLTAAYGSHTKYVRGSNGAKENVEFDESGEKVIEGELPKDA